VCVCVCACVEVVICSILTGDLQVVAQPTGLSDLYLHPFFGVDDCAALRRGLSDSDEDALQAINATNTAFVVWSSHRWFVYSLAGHLLSTTQMTSEPHTDILAIGVLDDDHSDAVGGHRLSIVWKGKDDCISVAEYYHTLRLKQTGNQSTRHMLRLQSNVIALSLSRRQQIVYSCDANNDVMCYTRDADNTASPWSRRDGWVLTNGADQLYSLILSADETLLIAQIKTGFKRWHLCTKRLVKLRLPSDVRNFPRYA